MKILEVVTDPAAAAVLKAVPAVSTWDDHDFGFNDSTAESGSMDSEQRAHAAEVFRMLWPNLYDRAGADDSIENSFRWGNVHVFVPDGRFNRKAGGNAQVLGDEQARALLEKMNESDAKVKILVSATQVIPDRGRFESFVHDAPEERSSLLDGFDDGPPGLLEIDGRILILSGDIHSSELCAYGGAEGSPALIELTSSPLLVKTSADKVLVPADDDDGRRIWSVYGEGYARVSITFSPEGEPTIRVECRESTGGAAEPYADGGGSGVDWTLARAVWGPSGSLTET